jgi:hypothetical protein
MEYGTIIRRDEEEKCRDGNVKDGSKQMQKCESDLET